MARPGYDQGVEDALVGRPPRDDGDEEYYISYRHTDDDIHVPEPPEQPDPRPEQPDPREEEVS